MTAKGVGQQGPGGHFCQEEEEQGAGRGRGRGQGAKAGSNTGLEGEYTVDYTTRDNEYVQSKNEIEKPTTRQHPRPEEPKDRRPMTATTEEPKDPQATDYG